MPNPFHDETGKFCSKEEMKGAVDRLEQRVAKAPNEFARGLAFDSYFQLRKEYESINNAVVEVPEEWVGKVANSGLSAIPDTTSGIEAYYRSGFSDGLRSGSFHEYGDRAIKLFINPQTPGWIKDELYSDASVDIKAGLIQKLSYGEKYPEVTSSDLLPFARGENGEDWMVVQSLLGSQRIGFDTKYELAERTGSLGTLIGRSDREAELYATVPDLEDKLLNEVAYPSRRTKQNSRALDVVAKNTRNPMTIDGLIESEAPNSYALVLLATNSNLDSRQKVRLLERVGNADSRSFAEVYESVRTGRLGDPATGKYAQDVRFYERQIKNFSGPSEKDREAALEKVNRANYLLDEADAVNKTRYSRESPEFTRNTLGAAQTAEFYQALAKLDSQPERYEGLQKEIKRREKELRKASRAFSFDLEETQRRLKQARKYREAVVLTNMLREHTDSRLSDQW